MNVLYQKSVPIEMETDILVIGGSQSGVSAAVCAKRTNPNCKVLLIEQEGYLGGQSVGTMVCHYEFREYRNNAGQDIVAGFGKELIRRVVEKGHSDPLYKEWLEGKGPPFKDKKDPRAMGDVPLDLNDLELVMHEMLMEAGVEVRLMTKFIDVVLKKPLEKINLETEKIEIDYVIVSDISSLKCIKTKIILDCTANNDVSYLAAGDLGIKKSKYKRMPMQTYAWFGNVDLDKFVEAFWKNPDTWQLKYPDNKEQMIQHVREGKVIMMRGGADYINEADEKFPGLLEQYQALGLNPPIYYWLKTLKTFKYEIEGKTKYFGTFAIEGPISFADQTDPEAISKLQFNQLIGIHLLRDLHSTIPGWENCYVERTSVRIGLRQTRILNGVYELTYRDVKGHAKFEDVIGRNTGHDVGRGNPKEEVGYDIPYRILVPKHIDGLLVGARSVSCEIDDETMTALNAHRGICSTMVVGQAIGTAAALCVQSNVQPRDLDIKLLQNELRRQNVILESAF